MQSHTKLGACLIVILGTTLHLANVRAAMPPDAQRQFDQLAERIKKPISDFNEMATLSKAIDAFLATHSGSVSNREYQALRRAQDELKEDFFLATKESPLMLQFEVTDNPRSRLKLPMASEKPTAKTLEIFEKTIPDDPFAFFDTLYQAGGGLEELKVELNLATSAATYLLAKTQRKVAKPNLTKIKEELARFSSNVDSLSSKLSTSTSYQNEFELTAALRRGLKRYLRGVSPRLRAIDACLEFKSVTERIGRVATESPGAAADVISKLPSDFQSYGKFLWDISVLETLLDRLLSEEQYPTERKR